ncbi:AAA family ATPase [Bradyrhizobium sp. CB1717]|uniref:AAA family ATPase n=1 Tax=Bradyrhizobium sp. CB1717 TaxID=3039154 RepID=UPI0024B2811D|nr:AAA family ATPase [Bradyrhizobium sp. CB1717]WFU21918.1 AAA family ATPase [Bradyrhizobium sp. CB1717]
MTDQYRENVAVATSNFDPTAIRTHFSHLHHAAARANVPNGKLCLAVYGEDPDTGERVTSVQHFAIGDHEGMAQAAMQFDGMPHHNVYAPLVVFKSDVEPGTRAEKDIAAVFGFVIDGDSDKGRAAPTSPLPADCIIESSSGNLQHFLFLDRPLPPDEAKAFGNAIKRATGADAANDIGHVWRVPGALNWPNASKLKRGRSREPQPVTVKQPWDKWTGVADLRAILAPHWETPRERAAVATPRGKACPDNTRRALDWMIENNKITNDESWRKAGMALRDEFGDDPGLSLFSRICHGRTVDKSAFNRWYSYTPGDGIGIGTLRHMVNEAGCPHTIRDKIDWTPAIANLPAVVDAAPRFLFETLSDLRRLPVAKWLVDGWIPEQGVGLFYGEYAGGKSFIIFDLILHLVYGLPEWHGTKLPGQPIDVLYIAREGASGFRERVDAFKAHHGITADTDRLIFMRSPANLGDASQFEDLKAAVAGAGRAFKMAVVDTVGRALPGEDFNEGKSITGFMERLQQLGEIGGGVAVGVHHVNKSGEAYGSVYFGASSDFMFLVERDGDPKRDPLRRGRISCAKMKDGPDGWYRLVEYQSTGNSLVVARLNEGIAGLAGGKPKKLTNHDKLALQALGEALKAVGQSRSEMGGARCVTINEWLDACFKHGGVSPDAAKPTRDLHNRQVNLIAEGIILVIDGFVRIIDHGAGKAPPPVSNIPAGQLPLVPVR